MTRPSPEQRITPGPGQESVWDYPRPPRLEPTTRRIRIVHHDRTVADTTAAMRVLETSHPPTYYLPPADVDQSLLRPAAGASFCEWKGPASYFDLVVEGEALPRVAWTYPQPTGGFAPIAKYYAFYPGPLEACFVDDERVQSQAGDFYGGWITRDVVGPFKGASGTAGW